MSPVRDRRQIEGRGNALLAESGCTSDVRKRLPHRVPTPVRRSGVGGRRTSVTLRRPAPGDKRQKLSIGLPSNVKLGGYRTIYRVAHVVVTYMTRIGSRMHRDDRSAPKRSIASARKPEFIGNVSGPPEVRTTAILFDVTTQFRINSGLANLNSSDRTKYRSNSLSDISAPRETKTFVYFAPCKA